MKYRSRLCVAYLAPLLLGACLRLPISAQELEIVFLNVGQGEATLVISPSGQTMLIDAGENGQGDATVLPYLNARGLTEIDIFVASHYHADHIGGIDEIIAGGVPVGVAYDRGGSYTTLTYNSYVNAVGGARTTIGVGQVIDLGGGATATCVAANGVLWGGGEVPVVGANQEENARSVTLLIEMGEFQLLTGGDLTGGGSGTPNVEGPLGALIGDVEVLKVSHHGSNTSTHGDFLVEVKPEVAIISAGDGNPFGHRHVEVIDRLTALPSTQAIFQTESASGNPSPLIRVANGPLTLTTTGAVTATGEYVISGDSIDTEVFPINDLPFELVINEIMKNPSAVPDADGEYVEIYNRGNFPVDLDGWILADADFDRHEINAAGGLVVAPGEYLVLGRNDDPLQNGGYEADYVYDDFLLGNSGDEVILAPVEIEGALFTVDRVHYTRSAFPDTPGRSLELVDVTADNFLSRFWVAATLAFGRGDFGTPGGLNSTATPPQLPFVRGDADGDGVFNGLDDGLFLLSFQFGPSAPAPPCFDAADADNNGVLNGLLDALTILNFQFVPGSAAIPPPHPRCGLDDDHALGCHPGPSSCS